MVLDREKLLSRISEKIGDSTTDEDIALLEDVADTYDDLRTRAESDIDWEARYNELDRTWRERYIERFNGKVESDSDFVEEPKDADETILEYEFPKTYDELFEVGDENG